MSTPHVRTITVSAPDMDALQDGIVALSRALPHPDMIAAIRVDDTAFRAELDISPRPVDPRNLH